MAPHKNTGYVRLVILARDGAIFVVEARYTAARLARSESHVQPDAPLGRRRRGDCHQPQTLRLTEIERLGRRRQRRALNNLSRCKINRCQLSIDFSASLRVGVSRQKVYVLSVGEPALDRLRFGWELGQLAVGVFLRKVTGIDAI